MTSIAAWRERAEAGDPFAQLVLANAYLTGRHAPQSFEQALRWLDAACASNHADALLYRATLAALGLGRPRNPQEAFDLVVRAADAGSERAKAQLAVLSDASGRFKLEDWTSPVHGAQYFRNPRIYTVQNFIPKAACDWLIALTRPHQQPAIVLDRSGAALEKSTRTNSAATIDALETDLVVQLINARIAGAIGLPVTHQEPANVLYYRPGQEYKPHHDYLTGGLEETRAAEIEAIGQRVATFLIYLNDGYEGGETAFPRLGWRWKGRAGDALLFWSAAADGTLEQGSLHAGLPVLSGEKWLLSKWVRAKPIPLDNAILFADQSGGA